MPIITELRNRLIRIKLLDASTAANETSPWLDVTNMTNIRLMILVDSMTETIDVFENLSQEQPTANNDTTQLFVTARNVDFFPNKLQVINLDNTLRSWIQVKRGTGVIPVTVDLIGLRIDKL